MEVERFEGWALLELMGHRRRAGFVRDVEMFGTRLLRIDIPLVKETPATQAEPCGDTIKVKTTEFYGGGAVYGLHPCDEETARKLAHTTTSDSPIYPYTAQAAITHTPRQRELWEMDGDVEN